MARTAEDRASTDEIPCLFRRESHFSATPGLYLDIDVKVANTQPVSYICAL